MVRLKSVSFENFSTSAAESLEKWLTAGNHPTGLRGKAISGRLSAQTSYNVISGSIARAPTPKPATSSRYPWFGRSEPVSIASGMNSVATR